MSFFGNFREKPGSLPYRRSSQWDVPKSNPSALQVPQWKSDGTMDWKTLAPVDIGFPTPQPFPGFFYVDFTNTLTTFGTGAANLVLTGQGTTSDPTWVSPFDATAPTTSAVGDAAAAGSATTSAHRDHRHGREAFAAPTTEQTVGSAAATGTALTIPRSDHAHGNPTAASIGTAIMPAATAFTPTLSSTGGSAPGTATALGWWFQVGKMLWVEYSLTITTAAPATGYITATLPNSLTAVRSQYGIHGREGSVTGKAIAGNANTGTVTFYLMDNNVTAVNTYGLIASGWVEVS